MTPYSDQTISRGLADQLADLSRAAADAKADPKMTNQIQGIAAKTLAEIDAQISNLNVSSTHFVKAIKDLIMSGEWAKLPPPTKMIERTSQLMAVSDAIRDVQKTIMTDISAIMAVLLEIQRKAALAKGQERLQERSSMLFSALAEFSKKEEAAKTQKVSDLAQAGIQIVTGTLSVAMSSKSFIDIGGANLKTKEAWKKTGDMGKGTMDMLAVKTDYGAAKAEVPAMKAILANPGASKGDKDAATAKIAKANELGSKAQVLEESQKFERMDVDRLNSEAHEITQKARVWQDLTQAVGGVMNKTVDMGAAELKFMASKLQIEADKEGLAKNLAQSGEQAALDAYQQLRDSLKSALQMIQAIEQALSSSLSALSRIS